MEFVLGISYESFYFFKIFKSKQIILINLVDIKMNFVYDNHNE